jgi:hypothetical protein
MDQLVALVRLQVVLPNVHKVVVMVMSSTILHASAAAALLKIQIQASRHQLMAYVPAKSVISGLQLPHSQDVFHAQIIL